MKHIGAITKITTISGATGEFSTSLTVSGLPVTAGAAGSNTQVQFNDSGTFGGDAGLTYNKATDTLTTITITGTSGQFSGTISSQTALTNRLGIGTSSPDNLLHIVESTVGSAPTAKLVRTDVRTTNANDIPIAFQLDYIDDADGNRTSAQVFRLTLTKNAGATSTSSAFDGMLVITSNLNENMAGSLRGIVLEAPTVAAGKTLTTYVAVDMNALSAGAGTITNKYAFSLPVNAVDPTGGGGAAVGRIPILVGGVLRYIPYY